MTQDRDCECPGEVKFGPDPSALTAVVAAVAMFEDPFTEEDWRPALALARDGWTADRPNTLALVPSIAAKGVAIKGKVMRVWFFNCDSLLVQPVKWICL